MTLENTTDGIFKWHRHCASGEEATAKSTATTELSPGGQCMRNYPRWVMLSEGHLEHSFWLPPWAPTAGHSLFLPGSAPAHSVTPCTCHTPRRNLMCLLPESLFSATEKFPFAVLVSVKRDQKPLEVKKMSFRVAEWFPKVTGQEREEEGTYSRFCY